MIGFDMPKSPSLQITIDNKQDIELFDLATAMASISSEYHGFLKQTKGQKIRSESKLYVKKISQGSIIMDLCEKAPALLPGVAPLLIEYSGFLTNTLDYLVGKAPSLPDMYHYLRDDFLNIKKLIEPIANMQGNTLNFTGINFGRSVVINNTYNSIEASAAQNRCDRESSGLKKQGTV